MDAVVLDALVVAVLVDMVDEVFVDVEFSFFSSKSM